MYVCACVVVALRACVCVCIGVYPNTHICAGNVCVTTYILQYIYIYIYIQSTPDKSDTQGTGKGVRLSEMSDLSDIHNIMQNTT